MFAQNAACPTFSVQLGEEPLHYHKMTSRHFLNPELNLPGRPTLSKIAVHECAMSAGLPRRPSFNRSTSFSRNVVGFVYGCPCGAPCIPRRPAYLT